MKLKINNIEIENIESMTLKQLESLHDAIGIPVIVDNGRPFLEIGDDGN